MTDLERLREAFSVVGIAPKDTNVSSHGAENGAVTAFQIEGNGYFGFVYVFEFDTTGKLVQHGGWE